MAGSEVPKRDIKSELRKASQLFKGSPWRSKASSSHHMRFYTEAMGCLGIRKVNALRDRNSLALRTTKEGILYTQEMMDNVRDAPVTRDEEALMSFFDAYDSRRSG